MPLKPFFSIPKTLREWSEWCRNTDVEPGAETVTEAMLADNAVSNRALRDSSAFSVIGNPTSSSATPSDIASGANDTFLARRAGAIQFVTLVDGDIPSGIARDTEVTSAISAHEALSDPHPGYTTAAELATAVTNHEAASDPHTGYAREGSTTVIGGAWSFSLPPVLPTYTVATLPSAATYARGLIYVSDETGGAIPAFSDGTNWRRVTDRAVVA
jgi:hypothetical protein